MKLSIYNTDEENLLLVPKPTDEWISCEIFRCYDESPEFSSSLSLQYEVWRTIYYPEKRERQTQFIGVYDFLREAFEKAHELAAESKNIKDLSYSLKNIEEILLEEGTVDDLEKDIDKENEPQEFSGNIFLLNKLISRSIN